MRLALPQRHPRDIDLVLWVDFLAALIRLERVLVLAWSKIEVLVFLVFLVFSVQGLGFRVWELGFRDWLSDLTDQTCSPIQHSSERSPSS